MAKEETEEGDTLKGQSAKGGLSGTRPLTLARYVAPASTRSVSLEALG